VSWKSQAIPLQSLYLGINMATSIQLKHKASGVLKTGYFGFSWTTLFFGPLPALFRGDFLTFAGAIAVLFLLGIATFGVGAYVAAFAWAFFYNSYFTKTLLENGYEFADYQSKNEQASRVLGVAYESQPVKLSPENPVKKETHRKDAVKFTEDEKTLSNDAYKIYLVKKYPIEFNDVLKKYIFDNKLFDSIDSALAATLDKEKLAIAANGGDESRGDFRSMGDAVDFLESIGCPVDVAPSGKITVADGSSTYYFYNENHAICEHEVIAFAKMKAAERV
jgi:hypothetical protein